TERADLLQGPAGLAAGLLGLPGGQPQATGERAMGPDASFAVLHGLYWLAANLAGRSPLCLVVDDAPWADRASLPFLAFPPPRLEELRATLLVGARPREADTDADLLGAVTTDSSAEVIRLAPLTRSAVEQFLTENLGEPPDADFVEACLRATRGTPLLMRELV